MEVVQQKVTSFLHGLETQQNFQHIAKAVVVESNTLLTPHLPAFPTIRPSEMASDTFPFIVGCAQATASNHKVVADCHSQIAVRASPLAVTFPELIQRMSFYVMFRSPPNLVPVCRAVIIIMLCETMSGLPPFSYTGSSSTSHERHGPHPLFAVSIRRTAGT